MAAWRIWFWSIFVVLVLAATALFSAVWRNLSTEWNVETNAAQFALDHSPINHIDSHDEFTAADVQEVFSGTDVFGRKWYAFVYGSPFTVQYVSQSSVVSAQQVLNSAKKLQLKPNAIHLGYLDDAQQAKFKNPSNVVYEVVGTDDSGATEYAYFDGQTGKLAWKYVLST